ncbi:hypothetical protein EC957_005256 [Mortierella hygrophila]|uniref:RNase H type-1 domain-containing protein n=1 Tax=Mortierella hygrophila TaxID=979708 RepID=A0A9P6K708_9FUNG|nr:hypothetical protein EC957_005256 [Mortierella hygrophila]
MINERSRNGVGTGASAIIRDLTGCIVGTLSYQFTDVLRNRDELKRSFDERSNTTIATEMHHFPQNNKSPKVSTKLLSSGSCKAPPSVHMEISTASDTHQGGYSMYGGGSLYSSVRHHAEFQTDGNLCVADNKGKKLWCAMTQDKRGNDPYEMTFQWRGFFRFYDKSGTFSAAFQLGEAMDPFSENDLRCLPLNTAWELLRNTAMSSAFAHLPSTRTGGRPLSPEGEELLLSKIHEIGGIIWSARVTFIELQLAEETTKEGVHGKIVDWYHMNGTQSGVSNAPDMEATTQTHASSAKAELMGLLAAVLSAPPEQDIVVKLDNQSVVEQYSRDTLQRKRFRITYMGIWAVLWQVVESRPGGVEVMWVKGHNTAHGNELADQAAKMAAQSGSVPLMVDLAQQTDITTFAHCYGGLVEIDLRQLLKQKTTIRHHQVRTSQRQVRRAIPDIDDAEWNSNLAYVHDRHAVFSFYSDSKDSHQLHTSRQKAA